MGFFAELKRRNVIRVAGVYIVVGWLLVQVATALEETLGLPAWFDGLVVALLLIGLPVALVLAWAFELTPEGVVRTEAVPAGTSITGTTARKLDTVLAAAMIALIVVIVWQQSHKPEVAATTVALDTQPASGIAKASTDASVAVLPFADMSPEGDQEYFSDGLSEEILNLLVRADAIEVASRTSSFQFKNTSMGIPEIAAELNVRHIVEGSVRKSGETIRVTAQLIDAVTDRHLWSDTYDRPLTVENLFAIQDDVANSIFEALREKLGLVAEPDLRAKRMTEDVDAYALFLQARTLYQARRALDDVDDLLARAIELDPGFAAAWAYRAGTQFLMQSYRYSDLPIDELLRRGLEYAQRALELDPESATATAVIANMYVSQRTRNVVAHDWVDIIDLYDRAIELDPRDGSALNWRGLAYAWVGYLDLALADFRQCVRYEPLYSPCVENLHWFLADMGRDDEALEVLRKSLDAGDSKILYSHLGLLARRNNELAFKAATNDVEALRDWRHHDELYRAFHDLDADHAALAASIAEFAATHPDRSPDFMYPLLMALGHYTDATNAIGIWSDTGKKYRQSGHFRDFMRRIGAVDYWNEVGPPPGCRLLGDNDFECD